MNKMNAMNLMNRINKIKKSLSLSLSLSFLKAKKAGASLCSALLIAAPLSLLALTSASSFAQSPASTNATPSPAEAAAERAQIAARSAAQLGPQNIKLGDQGAIDLPKGYAFVPQPQAMQLLNAMGNPGNDPRLRGLIMPVSGDEWFVTVRYEDAGYIKDDDAKDWNADDLLKSYREGTDASNEERAKMGVPQIEIVGWAEKPAYDATTHRLVWAMSSKEKGEPAGQPQGVNYNTYALGREGYFTLNLVTGLDELAANKPVAKTLLAALNFNEGKRYTDFNASTDRVAEYGLAALVAGVAAKKLGFFALIAVFFAKFAKVIMIGVALLGGGIFKFFKREKSVDNEPKTAPTPMREADAYDAGKPVPDAAQPTVTQTMLGDKVTQPLPHPSTPLDMPPGNMPTLPTLPTPPRS